MKLFTLQISAFLALIIATHFRARSYHIDIIGDGKLTRDPSWEPWAMCWYIIAAILQIITFLLWDANRTTKQP